jgi:hypothetical protein
MFARPVFGNPFQPFAVGASPFWGNVANSGITPSAAQFGGYNPFVPFPSPLPNPINAFGLNNPALSQFGSYGVHPYLAAQLAGGIPSSISPLLPGLTPTINPFIAAQLAATNPAFLPQLAPQVLGGAFGLQTNPGLTNPLFQPMSSEASYPGLTPFINPLGLGNIGQGVTPFNAPINPWGQGLPGANFTQTPAQGWGSPYGVQDPITSTLLAQQLNPLAQSKLPIRPLTALQQVDPYQGSLSGVPGSIANPPMDPYSLLAQSQLMSQYAVNPIQQMARAYPMANWTGSPYGIGGLGQTTPIGQAGTFCGY